jgi:hypothetical protein
MEKKRMIGRTRGDGNTEKVQKNIGGWKDGKEKNDRSANVPHARARTRTKNRKGTTTKGQKPQGRCHPYDR